MVWAGLGPAAEDGARSAQFRRGPHHRLSLRPWPRHAHGHHGRHRARRARRHSREKCRGPRNARKSGHARRGQDRHAHRRPPARHLDHRRARRERIAKFCASPRRSNARSEHPLAAAILAAAKERGIAPAMLRIFIRAPAKASPPSWTDANAALGNRALFAELGISLADLDERAKSLEAEGETVMFVARDGQSDAASSASPIPLSQQRQKPSNACIATESRS